MFSCIGSVVGSIVGSVVGSVVGSIVGSVVGSIVGSVVGFSDNSIINILIFRIIIDSNNMILVGNYFNGYCSTFVKKF
ncbi:MAG: hypothetical protein II685_03290 [Clostridia bacterium]|nr:hypothetical protein [Clostridia bacterium]